MFWMLAVMAAQKLEEGKQIKGQAKVDKLTFKSNTKVQNTLTAASNILGKAKGDLARYQQANNNKYKLIAGAENVESQRVNMLRLSDEAVRGSFDQRIAVAEISGALAAATGGAGIGGGSIDAIDASNRIRAQRAQELRDRTVDTQLYDAQRNIDQTWEATVLGLDDIQYNDSLNYMQAQTPYVKEPSWAQIGIGAGMQFAQAYNSMGGFDNLKTKLPGWLGGAKSDPNSFGAQAGRTVSTSID
jgi:hypothetical protein